MKENNISLKIPKIELKEKDLIKNLCEQVKKIDILKSKINFIFGCVGKTEKDFLLYEEIMKNLSTKISDSKIVEPADFLLVAQDIKEKMR